MRDVPGSPGGPAAGAGRGKIYATSSRKTEKRSSNKKGGTCREEFQRGGFISKVLCGNGRVMDSILR